MSVMNPRRDRDANGRLKRALRRHPYPQSTPGWWVRLHMTRPQRYRARMCCHRVLIGEDPDGIVWPLGNHKPHEYYW